MAVPEDKARIAITLGKPLLARLDEYCERTGMTRSGYIAYVLAHQLDTETQVTDYVNDAIGKMFAQLAANDGLSISDFAPKTD